MPECIEFPLQAVASRSDWLEQVPFREGCWNVIRRVQAQLLKSALAEAKGNKAEAARILGVQRRLLYGDGTGDSVNRLFPNRASTPESERSIKVESTREDSNAHSDDENG